MSNGYLHVWCSRVLETVQFLIEVLESKRTIMISRLWQDNQCYWHSLLLVYYFNFAANTGYFGENYYVLIHAPEVDTLYSILVSSHPTLISDKFKRILLIRDRLIRWHVNIPKTFLHTLIKQFDLAFFLHWLIDRQYPSKMRFVQIHEDIFI